MDMDFVKKCEQRREKPEDVYDLMYSCITLRNMAPLSKELTGLILPHDRYGSHLNERGSMDVDLEENFKLTGNALAKIWLHLIVDNFPTVAEYIEPTKSELLEQNLLSRDQK